MMRRFGLCAAMVLAIAGAAAARADAPPPDVVAAEPEQAQPLPADPVQRYRLYGYLGMSVDGPQGLRGWDEALKAALKHASPAQAARRLAPAWGLSEAQMAELIDLWIAYHEAASVPPRPGPPALARALAARAEALVRASGGARLPTEAAGVVVSGVGGCDAAHFRAMTRGLPDPAAAGWWLVLADEDCAPWRSALLALAPEKAAALMLLEARAEHDAAELELALKDWAASDAAMAHVAAGDRPRAAAAFARRKLTHLLRAGLAGDAVAYADALGPERLAAALAPIPPGEIVVDGLPLRLDGEQATADARLEVAAGYAAVGRPAEARALLARVGGLRRAWAAAACEADLHRLDRSRCPVIRNDSGERVMLDQLLNRPDEDPYLLAETRNGAGPSGGPGVGVWAEVACRLFSDPQYRWICREARRRTALANAGGEGGRADLEQAQAALAAAAIPDWSARRARAAQALDSLARANPAARTGADVGSEPAPVLISAPAADCAGDRAEAGRLLGLMLTGGEAPVRRRLAVPDAGWTIYPPSVRFEPLVTWPPAEPAAAQPLAVEGDPADFACLRADRPVLVHTAAQAERLRRQEGQATLVIRLGPVTLDRARTRGFVVWSNGVSGGAVRLLRTAKGWSLEEYDSWIR